MVVTKAQALTPVGGEVISVFQLLREWNWRKVTRKRHPGARLCHVPAYIALSDSGVRILGVDVLPLGSGGSLGIVWPLSDLSPLHAAFWEGWLGGEHLIEQRRSSLHALGTRVRAWQLCALYCQPLIPYPQGLSAIWWQGQIHF